MKRYRPTTQHGNSASPDTLFLASDLAFPSGSPSGSLPCCVLHQPRDPPKVLSYASFAECLELHRKWLASTIRTAMASCGEQELVRTKDGTDSDVVVAYVSGNAPDALLSVLACTSPSLKPAIPALLNTRWTPSEMVSSLRSRVATKQQRAITIVLHDGSDSLERVALRVSNDLKRDATTNTHHQHSSLCLAIPKFSGDWWFEQPSSVPAAFPAKGFGSSHHQYHHHHHQYHHHHDDDDDDNDRSVRDRIRRVSQIGSGSDALILFTSGTTGGSKGVRLSHRALLVQSLAKLGEPCGYSSATAMLATTVPLFHVGGLSSFVAVLLARGKLVFPARWGDAGHANSNSSNSNSSSSSSSSNSSTSFRVDDIPRSMQQKVLPVNTLVVVPAMLSAWFASSDAAATATATATATGRLTTATGTKEQYPNTRCVLIGGQSASLGMIQRLKHVFPNARIAQTYACTEAASSMTFLSLSENNNNNNNNKSNADANSNERSDNTGKAMGGDCVGKPPDHIQVLIYPRHDDDDDDDGKGKGGDNDSTLPKAKSEPIVEPFRLGLIATRGPHVMNGYWKRGAPPDSSIVLHNNNNSSGSSSNHHRWFLGTDLGFWDDRGRLWFGGRAKDVVRTGGETVLAREVEAVLSGHPGVAECAVFPRRDERYGEAVACAVVPAAGKPGLDRGPDAVLELDLDLAAIKHWCRQRGLAGYKQPKFLVRVDSLPRNSSGKLLKHELIARFGNAMKPTTPVARSKL